MAEPVIVESASHVRTTIVDVDVAVDVDAIRGLVDQASTGVGRRSGRTPIRSGFIGSVEAGSINVPDTQSISFHVYLRRGRIPCRVGILAGGVVVPH